MTKTETEIRVIARDQLEHILRDGPLRDALHRYFARRITEQQEALTHFVTLDSEHRLAMMLLHLARRLGARRFGPILDIRCKLTTDELAQMVGTTRSRIGYFLKCFEAQNMVARRARVLSVHEDLLVEYLHSCV